MQGLNRQASRRDGLQDVVHPDLTIPTRSCVLNEIVCSKQVTQFELEQRGTDDPRVVVLSISGELDLTNAQELRERVDAAEFTKGTALVLDLTRVAFIDSAALHVLFRAARGMSKQRFGLVVEPVSAISRTLEIVGISEVATLGGSVDDLTAQLSAS